MSGQKKEKPDRTDEGWRDYTDAESVGERDGADDLKETEDTVRRQGGRADADGDGKPDPALGSSDFVSRDVKTELDKDRLKDK